MAEVNIPSTLESDVDPTLLSAPGHALGRDPFDDIVDPDPFEKQLDQLEATCQRLLERMRTLTEPTENGNQGTEQPPHY